MHASNGNLASHDECSYCKEWPCGFWGHTVLGEVQRFYSRVIFHTCDQCGRRKPDNFTVNPVSKAIYCFRCSHHMNLTVNEQDLETNLNDCFDLEIFDEERRGKNQTSFYSNLSFRSKQEGQQRCSGSIGQR